MNTEYEPTSEDLQLLREWIKKMPHIPQDFDDKFLGRFLSAAKGGMQKAKIKLEGYCGLGQKFPEVGQALDPKSKEVQEYLQACHFYAMPRRTEKDEVIVISGFRRGASQSYMIPNLCVRLMRILMSIKEDEKLTTKVVAVVDCKHLTLQAIKDVTPRIMILGAKVFQEASPVRPQGVHYVNVPIMARKVIDFFKAMKISKIGERIVIHENYETLHEHIPKDLLPIEFGGTCGRAEDYSEKFREELMANRDYLAFENQRNRKLDHLRPKPKEEDFQLADSFRKLDFD